MHDADAAQAGDGIAQGFTQAPDLPVESLHQDYVEALGPCLAHAAGQRHLAQNGNAFCHAVEKSLGDRLVHRHLVLLLVLSGGAQDVVDDIPVTGEEDEAFAVLVQTPHRVDPGRLIDYGYDIGGLPGIGGAHDTHGLIDRQVYSVAVGVNKLFANHHPRS